MSSDYEQWDRRKKWLYLGLVLLASCIMLGVTRYLPIDERIIPVVRIKDRLQNIALNSGEEIKFKFIPRVSTLKGVRIYADAGYFGGGLRAEIFDKDGRRLASSVHAKSRYSDVRTTITFLLPVSGLKANDPLTVVIKNLGARQVSLWRNDVDIPGQTLLSVSLIEPTRASQPLRYGMYVGIIFFLLFAIANLFLERGKRVVGVVLILVSITPAVLSGLLHLDKWGISDWDFYMSVHSSYRQSIVENHAFPFWDPYTAGGTAGVADPEFPVFSPLFIPELVFGVPVGMRIAVMISIIVGGLGMFRLAMALKLGVVAATLSAIGFMFGSVNLLEIIEGHVNIYMAMWIPWVMWSWLGMVRGGKRPLLCGIFLALTFYGGGIYLLMYTAIAFAGLGLFTVNPVRTLVLTVKAGLWALGLSAVKLIPVFLWLNKFPDNNYASSTNTLPWLKQVFLERIPHGADVIFGQGGGWHEYGAYVGPVIIVLALMGAILARKEKMARVLLLSAVAAVAVSASGPFLKPFFDVFPYIPRSNISRFVLFAIIPILLLSSYGIDCITKKFKHGYWMAMLAIGLVAIDLMSYSYLLSRQAFVLDPVELPKRAAYPIEYTAEGNYANKIDVNGEGVKYSRSYGSFLGGYGSTIFPSVLGPRTRVKVIQYEEHDYLELENKRGQAKVIDWSPNRVTVLVKAESNEVLSINANYDDGWFANENPALEYQGRVATKVQKGEHIIVFKYNTRGFTPGAAITIATIILAIYYKIRRR